jgi:predicted O-methyltransferase YrrM
MTPFQFNLARGLIYGELRLRGYKIDEGGSSPQELQYLYETAKSPGVKSVAEIGFHLGFSSYAFLKAQNDISVVSFDIGTHSFISGAKKIIDRKFPGRHTLIRGDSTKTVPEFSMRNPNRKFDLIFIDGGHEYEIVKADICNMRLLARVGTIVIVDDLASWLPWGKGPARAWEEAIQVKEVVQDELYKDGQRVKTIEPPGRRAWALGRYLFKE